MKWSARAGLITLSLAWHAAGAQQPGEPDAGASRRSLLFEFSAGVGYTGVDVMKWASAGTTAEEQILYAADLRVFFAEASGFQLGLEGGYRYFLYYRVLSGSTLVHRWSEATRIGGVARRQLAGPVAVDLGAAFYLFEDFVDLGVSGALAFRIPAGRVTLPLHFRTDIVLDEAANIVGPSITIGLGLRR